MKEGGRGGDRGSRMAEIVVVEKGAAGDSEGAEGIGGKDPEKGGRMEKTPSLYPPCWRLEDQRRSRRRRKG